MPPSTWTVIAMVVLGAAIGLLVPRLRRRAQRDLHGDGVFEANVRSLGSSPHGLSQGWSSAAGALVSHGGELVWLDPWAQVWTVVFADGSRVELAVTPADAHHLGPWQRFGN